MFENAKIKELDRIKSMLDRKMQQTKDRIAASAKKNNDEIEYYITHSNVEFDHLISKNVMLFKDYLRSLVKGNKVIICLMVTLLIFMLALMYQIHSLVSVAIFILASIAFYEAEGKNMLSYFFKGYSIDFIRKANEAAETIVGVGANNVYSSKNNNSTIHVIPYNQIDEIMSASYTIRKRNKMGWEIQNEIACSDYMGHLILSLRNYYTESSIDPVADIKSKSEAAK